MPVVFNDVKQVLDTIIANWQAGNGGVAPQLTLVHGASFIWDTREHLLAATAKGIQLIQPGIIGQKGQGATANLVVAFTAGIPPYPQMPDNGLDSVSGTYLDLLSPQVQTIVQWIEGGCLP